MSRFALIVIFNLLMLTLKGQSLDSLVNDIERNCHSYKALKKTFNQYSNTHCDLVIANSWINYPYFATRELTLEIEHDVFSWPNYAARIFYKRDKIIYLGLVKRTYDYFARMILYDTIFRYIDTAYSRKVLIAHNAVHNTDFKISDMYEGNEDYYPTFNVYDNGLIEPRDGLSREIKKLFDAVLSRDSSAVISYASSFSPEMTAYGAVGLYIWSKEINPLDDKAQGLLNKLRRSKQNIMFHPGGCIIEKRKLSFALDLTLEEMHSAFLSYRQKLRKRAF